MNFLVGNNIIRIRGSRSSSATLSEVAVEKDYKDDLGRPIKKRDVHTKTNTTIEINEKIPVVGGGTRADEENRGILEAGDNSSYFGNNLFANFIFAAFFAFTNNFVGDATLNLDLATFILKAALFASFFIRLAILILC